MADSVKITMIGSRASSRRDLKRVYDASLEFLTKYDNGWLVSGHSVGVDNTAELAAVEACGVILEKGNVNRVNWDEIKAYDLARNPRIIMYLPDLSPEYYNTRYVNPVDKDGNSLPMQLLPVNFDNMPSTMTFFPPYGMSEKGKNLAVLFNPQGKLYKTLIRDMAEVLGSGSPKAIVNGVAYSARPSFYKSEEDGNTYLGNDLVTGNTGQAVRLAMFLGLPCWNLSDQKQYAEFMNLVANGQLPAQRQFRDNIEDAYEALEAAFDYLRDQGIKIDKYEDIAGMRLRGFFKNDGPMRLEPIPQEELERLADYTPFPIEAKFERENEQSVKMQNKETEERMLYSVHKETPIVTAVAVKMKDVPPEMLSEKLQQTIDAIVMKATAEGKTEKRFYGLNVLDFSRVEEALQAENFKIQTAGDEVFFNDLFTTKTEEFKKNKEENSKYLKPKSLYYNFMYIAGLIQYFKNNPESQKTLGHYNGYTDSKNGAGLNAVSPAEAMNLYFYMQRTGLLNEVYNQYDPETNKRLPLTSVECFDKFRDIMIDKYYFPKLRSETIDKIWSLHRSLNGKKISRDYYDKKEAEYIKRAMGFARGLGINNPNEADFRPDFGQQNNIKENVQAAEERKKKYNSIFSSDENTSVKAVDKNIPVRVTPPAEENIESFEKPVMPLEEKEAEKPNTSTKRAVTSKAAETTAEKTSSTNPAGARKGNTAAKRARASAVGPKAF